MNSYNWLILVLLGGIMGALGQGIRAGLGFKKLRDEVGDDGAAFSAKFSASRFYTRIFLGFIVGALTAFYLTDENGTLTVAGAQASTVPAGDAGDAEFTATTPFADKATLIALIIAGYAGVDALEGLANKFIHTEQTRGTTSAISN